MRAATALLLLCTLHLAAQEAPHPKQGLADMLLEYLNVKYPGEDLGGDVLYVSVQRQRLFHLRNGKMLTEYLISTSAKGLGAARDSERTPEGLHRVSQRIGQGVPAGGVFRERVFTGENAQNLPKEQDLITTRILWLDGMEPMVNNGGDVDSHTRGIYIHGTPEGTMLGTPSSHGCIRMSDTDVIALFDQVPVGALVVILNN